MVLIFALNIGKILYNIYHLLNEFNGKEKKEKTIFFFFPLYYCFPCKFNIYIVLHMGNILQVEYFISDLKKVFFSLEM